SGSEVTRCSADAPDCVRVAPPRPTRPLRCKVHESVRAPWVRTHNLTSRPEAESQGPGSGCTRICIAGPWTPPHSPHFSKPTGELFADKPACCTQSAAGLGVLDESFDCAAICTTGAGRRGGRCPPQTVREPNASGRRPGPACAIGPDKFAGAGAV